MVRNIVQFSPRLMFHFENVGSQVYSGTFRTILYVPLLYTYFFRFSAFSTGSTKLTQKKCLLSNFYLTIQAKISEWH